MLQNSHRSTLFLIAAVSAVATPLLWLGGLFTTGAGDPSFSGLLYLLGSWALALAVLAGLAYLVSASVGTDSAAVLAALQEQQRTPPSSSQGQDRGPE